MAEITDAITEYTTTFGLVVVLALVITGFTVGRAWLKRLK
jgi:hypothetical protein